MLLCVALSLLLIRYISNREVALALPHLGWAAMLLLPLCMLVFSEVVSRNTNLALITKLTPE